MVRVMNWYMGLEDCVVHSIQLAWMSYSRRLKNSAVPAPSFGRQVSGVLLARTPPHTHLYASAASHRAAFPSKASGQDWMRFFEHPALHVISSGHCCFNGRFLKI